LRLNDERAISFAQTTANTALWFGLIAFGICAGLLAAQSVYLKRTPSVTSLIKPIALGVLTGVIAGGLAQVIFGVISQQNIATEIILIFQALCWGLAGLGVGFGASIFVPNYPTKRALLAGFLGGAIGGAVFILLGVFDIFSESAARVIGIAILGAAIGLTISAVEEILREAWLTVILGKNETTSVSLGQRPVTLGSASEADVHLPRSKFPPVTAILTIENAKVMMDNKLNNQKIALPNGSKINIGKITIVVNVRKGGIDKKRV
jgi:hypothetical protein